MNAKEEFLKLASYEEFDEKREMFRNLGFDRDIIEHMGKIFGKATAPEGESFNSSIHWDFPISRNRK